MCVCVCLCVCLCGFQVLLPTSQLTKLGTLKTGNAHLKKTSGMSCRHLGPARAVGELRYRASFSSIRTDTGCHGPSINGSHRHPPSLGAHSGSISLAWSCQQSCHSSTHRNNLDSEHQLPGIPPPCFPGATNPLRLQGPSAHRHHVSARRTLLVKARALFVEYLPVSWAVLLTGLASLPL